MECSGTYQDDPQDDYIMTSRRDVTGLIREVIPKWPNFVLYFQVAG